MGQDAFACGNIAAKHESEKGEGDLQNVEHRPIVQYLLRKPLSMAITQLKVISNPEKPKINKNQRETKKCEF